MKDWFKFLRYLRGWYRISREYSCKPYEVLWMLDNYQRVICDITHGFLSKPCYDAETILRVAKDKWCDYCDLKDNFDLAAIVQNTNSIDSKERVNKSK